MTKTIGLSEARQPLPKLITRTSRHMERVVITRKGKPEAILMGFEEFECWVETLELMRNSETVRGIRKGLKDLAANRSQSFEEVFAEPLHGKPKSVRLSREPSRCWKASTPASKNPSKKPSTKYLKTLWWAKN